MVRNYLAIEKQRKMFWEFVNKKMESFCVDGLQLPHHKKMTKKANDYFGNATGEAENTTLSVDFISNFILKCLITQ